jgi:hypothetical protein
MLENFILYFYLLKQTCLYFLYIFLFEHSNKKKIQTDGKKKKKLLEADYWASSDVVRKNL